MCGTVGLYLKNSDLQPELGALLSSTLRAYLAEHGPAPRVMSMGRRIETPKEVESTAATVTARRGFRNETNRRRSASIRSWESAALPTVCVS